MLYYFFVGCGTFTVFRRCSLLMLLNKQQLFRFRFSNVNDFENIYVHYNTILGDLAVLSSEFQNRVLEHDAAVIGNKFFYFDIKHLVGNIFG
jgi:hypothetical protein